MNKEQIIKNLKSFGIGRLLDELSEEQAKAIQATRHTGKVSSVTIKLKYKSKGIDEVVITPSLTSSIPKDEIGAVSMFVDQDGQLHENDPRQMEIGDVIELPNNKKENVI